MKDSGVMLVTHIDQGARAAALAACCFEQSVWSMTTWEDDHVAGACIQYIHSYQHTEHVQVTLLWSQRRHPHRARDGIPGDVDGSGNEPGRPH